MESNREMHMGATAGCMIWELLQRGIKAPVRRRFQLSTEQGEKSQPGRRQQVHRPWRRSYLEWRIGGSPCGWSIENRERVLHQRREACAGFYMPSGVSTQ